MNGSNMLLRTISLPFDASVSYCAEDNFFSFSHWVILLQEDLDSIDWSNWTFDDGIFSKTTCIQGREISSSNDTVGSLNYDNNNGSNPPTTSLLLKDDSLAQLRGTNENSFLLSRSISPIIVDEEVEPYGPLKNFKNVSILQ